MINADASWWDEGELSSILGERPELFTAADQINPRRLLRSHAEVVALSRQLRWVSMKSPDRIMALDQLEEPHIVTGFPVEPDLTSHRWFLSLKQPPLIRRRSSQDSELWATDTSQSSELSADTDFTATDEQKISVASVVGLARNHGQTLSSSPREVQRLADVRSAAFTDPLSREYAHPSRGVHSSHRSTTRITSDSSTTDTSEPNSSVYYQQPEVTAMLNWNAGVPVIKRACYTTAIRWLKWGLDQKSYKKICVNNDLGFLFALMTCFSKTLVIACDHQSFAIYDKRGTHGPAGLRALSRSEAEALLGQNTQRVFKLDCKSGALSSAPKISSDICLVVLASAGACCLDVACPMIVLRKDHAMTQTSGQQRAVGAAFEAVDRMTEDGRSLLTKTTATGSFDMEINLPSYSAEEFIALLKYSPRRSTLRELRVIFQEFGTRIEAYADELLGIGWADLQVAFATLCRGRPTTIDQLLLRNHFFSIRLDREAVVLHGACVIPFRLFGWDADTRRLYQCLMEGYSADFVGGAMYTKYIESCLRRELSNTAIIDCAATPFIRLARLHALCLQKRVSFTLVANSCEQEQEYGGCAKAQADLSPRFGFAARSRQLEQASSSSGTRASALPPADPSASNLIRLRPSVVIRAGDLVAAVSGAVMDGAKCFLIEHGGLEGLTLGRVCCTDHVSRAQHAPTALGRNAWISEMYVSSRSSYSESSDTQAPPLPPSPPAQILAMQCSSLPARGPCSQPYDDSLAGVGVVLKHQNLSGVDSCSSCRSRFSARRAVGASASQSSSLPAPRLRDHNGCHRSGCASNPPVSQDRRRLNGYDYAESFAHGRYDATAGIPRTESASTIIEVSETECESSAPAASSYEDNRTREQIAVVELYSLSCWPYWQQPSSAGRVELKRVLSDALVGAELKEYYCELRLHAEQSLRVCEESRPLLRNGSMEALVRSVSGSGELEIALVCNAAARYEPGASMRVPSAQRYTDLLGISF